MNFLVIAVAISLVVIAASASAGYLLQVKEASAFYNLASLLVGGVLGYLTNEMKKALGNKTETTDTSTTTIESTRGIPAAAEATVKTPATGLEAPGNV